MPYPVQTFPTFDQLLTYINNTWITNGNQEITGVVGNNVVNGLLTFIRQSPLNYSKSSVESSGGDVAASTPVVVFTGTTPDSLSFSDNIYFQYVFLNMTSSAIPLAGSQVYYTLNGDALDSIPANSAVTIFKATNDLWVLANSIGGGGGSGTVTSFSAGNLSPLFTTSVTNSTTIPALSFALTNAAGGTLLGNAAGSSGAPSYTPNPVIGRVGTTGSLGLSGLTSGTVTIQPQAAAGTFNFNLPTTAGTSGYFLTSGGGGSTPMSWTQNNFLTAITADSGASVSSSSNVQLGSATSTGSPLLHHTFLYGASTYTLNINDSRFQLDKGANIVGGTNLTLGLDGNIFTVTGNAQINAITTANWQAGSQIVLLFTGHPLVKNDTAGGGGTATILLAGLTDFQSANGDALALLYDGTNWRETNRALASGASITGITADNGLTASTDTNVQLGGTLIQETIINLGNNLFTVRQGSAGVIAIDPPNKTSFFLQNNGSIESALEVNAVNVGNARFDLYSNNGVNQVDIQGNPNLNRITYTAGQHYLAGTNSGNGSIVCVNYGQGQFTGTTATYAAWDSSGNLIELSDIASAPVITADNGLNKNTATNVQFGASTATGAPLLHHTFLYGASTYTLNLNDVRLATDKGANVTAANNLTLGLDGNVFSITGNTQVNAITIADWQAGSQIALLFTGTPIIKNNTAGGAGTATILLAGLADFQVAAGDVLTLLYDGTNWKETNRTLASGSPVVTASNGLTKLVNDVKLGGSLTADTTISNGAFRILMTGSKADQTLVVNNSSSGTALWGISSSGLGGHFNSTTNIGARIEVSPVSTNTVITMAQIVRSTQGVGANGIGGSVDLIVGTSTSGNPAARVVNQIITTLTDATDATRTSTLKFTGVLSASTVDLMTLNANGSWQIRPITATAASAITPAEGMMLFTSDTNGTFVSIGFWGYRNGAWAAF